MKSFTISTLRRAAMIFSITAFLYAAAILAIYASAPEGANLSALRVVLIAPFSLFFAIGEECLANEKMPRGGAIFLHAGLTISGAFFFLILPATSDRDGSEKLIGFILTAAIYAVCAFFRWIFSRRLKRAKAEAEKYK